jgi:copper chaperone
MSTESSNMSNTNMQIEINNLKCGGCANTIVKGLDQIDGVSSVVVDATMQMVRLEADEATRPAIVARLHDMGYPEKGSVRGLSAAVAEAKSFVSCAVGRLT